MSLAERVAKALEAASEDEVARKMIRQVHTLRGVRGVPLGEVAKLASTTWSGAHPALPAAGEDLTRMFGAAWEDGLVAIALLAAALPDAPRDALELALAWTDRLDDVATADALGWMALGPCALLLEGGIAELAPLRKHPEIAVRRAVVMAAMACLPVPLEGPSAAALRARLGQRHAQWVDAPRSELVAAICDEHVRDEAPEVRKAMRRVLRAWTDTDPDAVAEWGDRWNARGGLAKLLGDEVRRARRRATAE